MRWQDRHQRRVEASQDHPSDAETKDRSGRSWGWGILGVALLAYKLEVVIRLAADHSWTVVVVCGLATLSSFLRGNLLRAALWASPLVALAVDPHSPLVGIAIAFGAFFALVACCMAIGALLSIGDRLA